MAKSDAVWGIDIGQCALKALRCRPHDKDEKRLIIDAFDYIEYPKILSQPEANREELIREALQQFVSRNDLTGERVAIAVPGQSGLARFIKLPPVERKKIPDIVKYEARQQIPFALEDVVWDYQPLIGSEDEGYAIETEVGLFAMKRDQVARHLKPLEEAGIDVEIIQLAPLAIYNFVCFDRLNIEGPYDPANPPKSTVIISLGTDTTDLVITNGYRVWQRSIPIGGNHFTKSLTKELKLTFAKAEHLKRNAMKSENPKAVFQAMRPVFSDLVAEIQRSIGFFTSNNRNAKLGDMVALGNPMKLPGLQRFLSQNLDQEVKLIDQFNNLVGGTATAGPQFKENQLTFGVAYGLCVQSLDLGQLKTNLLPEEIVTTRLVKAKKPCAVAAVAVLLLGVTISYFMHYRTLMTANVDDQNMKSAMTQAKSTVSTAQTFKSAHEAITAKFDEHTKIAANLQSNVDGRLLWLELLKAIDTALPKDTRDPAEKKETAEDIAKREELHITQLDCEYFADLTPWKTSIDGAGLYISTKEDKAPAGAAATTDGEAVAPDATAEPANPDGTEAVADGAADPNATADAATTDPAATDTSATDTGATDMAAADPMAEAPVEGTGEIDPLTGQPVGAGTGLSTGGWVIELRGYHLHNDLLEGTKVDVGAEGQEFVLDTFCKAIENGTVQLPDGPNGELVDVKFSDLGLQYPTVMTTEKILTREFYAQPVEIDASGNAVAPVMQQTASPEGLMAPPGTSTEPVLPETIKLRKYNFIVQFIWQPQPRAARIAKAQEAQGASASTAAVDGEAALTEPSS